MALQNEFYDGGSEPSWRQIDKYGLSYDDLYTADFSHSSGHHLPVLEFRVPFCCSKCQEKVYEELSELEGVFRVFCDQLSEKVQVIGPVDPIQALKKLKRIHKKSEFWNGSTILRSSHERNVHGQFTPRFDSEYHLSANQEFYYREASGNHSYEHSYRNADDCYGDESLYYRPQSLAFSLPPMGQSYPYNWVPPYAQKYNTENYASYTYY